MNKDLTNYAIILASGTGTRYSDETPKQFVKIAGKTVLEHTIELFEKNELIDNIIIVITPVYRDKANDILNKNNYKKIFKLVNGGETRKESSFIGISSIEEYEANVIIHDCARPFLSQRIINDCVNALDKYSAVDVAIPSADTIIKVNENIIENIPERKYLKRGQTPQCFKLSLIKKAHELSAGDSNFTDDCGLIVKYNLGDVYVVEGDNDNMKITYPSDIYVADRIFQLKSSVASEEVDIKEIKDKVMVVFGGTSGIGRSISLMAENYGAKVFPISLEFGCDVTSIEMVKKFLEKVYHNTKKIDYIVNTAGVLKIGKLIERSIDDIKKEVDVNYFGNINVVKASIPYLRESKGSIALFTSSSYTRGRAEYSTYSSIKSAIVNLVQALSEEIYEDGIKINAINPERTATPMREKAFGEEPEETLLKPEKVAETTLRVLLSDLTGEVFDVRRKEKFM